LTEVSGAAPGELGAVAEDAVRASLATKRKYFDSSGLLSVSFVPTIYPNHFPAENLATV
jgi:hypothetical protein